ncbi:MAG TPA: DUF433 domain-containing protein, partial [Chloroflexota bacterium]|nr:DUF433 domain-containing protein [Chloroflexota bacterium]
CLIMDSRNEQLLIEKYIDLDTDRYPGGRADARLREYGVPVWALIGQLQAIGNDLDQLATDYELPREAVEAALAYYRCNKQYIDARIALNAA